jgi:hypothetical protein
MRSAADSGGLVPSSGAPGTAGMLAAIGGASGVAAIGGRTAPDDPGLDSGIDPQPDAGSDDAGVVAACGAFPAISDLAVPGPFGATNAGEGPNCQIYRPASLGQGGVKHPIILWANGTGGPTFVYQGAFDHWTSHGFIVVAGNTSDGQGSGAELLGCLGYILEQGHTSGSIYAGKLCDRVGASGHSQGGGAALMAGRDPRVTATAPLMPYIQQGFGGFDQASIPLQHGPMLLLSGTDDTIAPPESNQRPVFEMTNVPVFWANLVGGNHVTVSLDGLTTYREVMLAWYRWQLMGDPAFRNEFRGSGCELCSNAAWQVKRKGLD